MRFVLIPLLSAGLAVASPIAEAAKQAGIPQALTPYAGQVLYLDFWASWCVPCAHSFPWLNEMQTHYGKRLKIVAVNVDEIHSDAERFLGVHPADFAVVFDPHGQLADYYHVAGMPSAVIIAPDGRVLHQHVGFRDADTGIYESAIADALGAAGTARVP